MIVRELIEALQLVGTVYRNRDGSKPADAVTKVIQQLKGYDELRLSQWAEHAKKPKPSKRQAATIDTAKIDDVLSSLESAETHSELHSEIGRLKLTASEWKALARKATGKSSKSGKDARDLTETHFSNLLLMSERVSSVKRMFLR